MLGMLQLRAFGTLNCLDPLVSWSNYGTPLSSLMATIEESKFGLYRGVAPSQGSKVNQGVGYGLEIPCKYQFF